MKSNRFIVLGAGLVIYLCMGSIYMWSVLAAQISREHPEWSLGSIALIFSLQVITYALVTVASGFLQDRIGPRWVVTAGGIMMGSGTILAGFADSWWGLIIGYSLLNGAGIGFSFVALACVLKWFPQRQRGLASGLLTGTFGGASVAFAPLAASLINSTGSIASTLKILGLIYLLAVTIMAQFINNPAGQDLAADDETAGEKGHTPGQMLIDRRFYVLLLLFVFGGISGLIILGNAQQFAVYYAGVSGTLAISAVSLLAIPNGVGSVAFGILTDRVGQRKALGVLFIACSLGLFLLPFTSSYLSFLLSASLVVVAYAGLFGIFPVASADYFGTRHFGVNYGLLYAGYGIAALIGPGLAARLAEHSQKTAVQAGAAAEQIHNALIAGYSQSIWLACAACVLGIIITLVFLKNRSGTEEGEITKKQGSDLSIKGN